MPPKKENKSTGQKAAEETIKVLHQTGGPFVAVVDKTRMPMVLSDPQLPGNPIVYVNDSFLALTGYDREEVLGQTYEFLMGPHSGSQGRAQFEAAFNGRFEGFPEVCLYRKDGSEFWASILIDPAMDADGTVRHHFISFIDVTRQKQDERLGFLLDELKHRVKNTLATVQSITAQTLRSAGWMNRGAPPWMAAF